MIGIYKITNLITNQNYIGQSIHIERRWQEHKLPSSTSLIGKAIKEYGIENFSFEVLEEIQDYDVDLLDELEATYIRFYDSITPKGYNVLEKTSSVYTTFQTFDKEIFYQIIDKISNTNETFDNIASTFGLNRRTINRINHGYTHHMPDLNYPLRNTKKEKQQNYCIDCGVAVSSVKTKRCAQCAAKFSRSVERPSREELKLLIRTLPFTKIGEKYKVSDNCIRKWCIDQNLPSRVKEIKNYSDEEWEKI